MGCGNSKTVESATKKKKSTSNSDENAFLDKNIPKFFIEDDDTNTLQDEDLKADKNDISVRISYFLII